MPNRARVRARIGERGRNVDAKHPGISIAPYTPRALVFFALRSEIRADATVSMQQQSRPNTVPANFLRRRTRPPVFLPPLSRLFPSCRPPLIAHCRCSARKNGRQAKIRRRRSQGGEKIGTIGRYPIPSILFRFPGETGKGKVTKEMHLGRDSLGEKNRVRSTRSTFFLYNCLSLKISSDNEISLNY